MTTFRLLQRELSYRKVNVLLTVLALTAAATLFVAGPTLLEGYRRESQRQLEAMRDETAAALAQMQQETDRELEKLQTKADGDLAELENRTRRIMRDLGFNLRIVHRDTDLTKLYAQFVSLDMPEEYVTRLAESPEVTKIAHLVATLRQMIEVEGQSRLVVGFAPEATQSHAEKKPPMGFQIERGKVYLGAIAGEGYAVGDSYTVRARLLRLLVSCRLMVRPKRTLRFVCTFKMLNNCWNVPVGSPKSWPWVVNAKRHIVSKRSWLN